VASISSVITGGFGFSASLVITDGYGIGVEAAADELIGRRHRRGRRPLWVNVEQGQKLQPAALKEESQYIAALVAESSLFDLREETRILQEALEIATARQRKTIEAMQRKIERRMAEIEDDEAAIVLIM
jgi:hypothetical protein